MNRPITPAEMQDWINKTWRECQDEAWEEKGMTKEDIIRMALQAGAKPSGNPEKWDVLEINDESLERFADLVAAHVRKFTSSQRQWVGLTDEDKSMFSFWLDHKTDYEVFAAIEDKLRSKNT